MTTTSVVISKPCLLSQQLASYTGLLTPVLVTCCHHTEEGLVKLVTCSDVSGCWVDMWRSGMLLTAVRWLSEPKKCCQDYLMSTAQSQCAVISSTLACVLTFFQECATPPQVHPMSLHVISFTKALLMLVLQVTNVGVRRPGWEGKLGLGKIYSFYGMLQCSYKILVLLYLCT